MAFAHRSENQLSPKPKILMGQYVNAGSSVSVYELYADDLTQFDTDTSLFRGLYVFKSVRTALIRLTPNSEIIIVNCSHSPPPLKSKFCNRLHVCGDFLHNDVRTSLHLMIDAQYDQIGGVLKTLKTDGRYTYIDQAECIEKESVGVFASSSPPVTVVAYEPVFLLMA